MLQDGDGKDHVHGSIRQRDGRAVGLEQFHNCPASRQRGRRQVEHGAGDVEADESARLPVQHVEQVPAGSASDLEHALAPYIEAVEEAAQELSALVPEVRIVVTGDDVAGSASPDLSR